MCTLVKERKVKESAVDRALARLLRVHFRLGYFNPPSTVPFQ